MTADVVRAAVDIGYRHLDSASDYGNEVEAGQGIARCLADGTVRREDLWVTSKLWNTHHRKEHVRHACEKSLRDLGLDYLDLYLIHFPLAQKHVPIEHRYPAGWFFDPDADAPRVELDPVPIIETWQAMERLVDAGLVREIGVCNFGCSLLRDLCNQATVPPAMLQVEMHPYLTQAKLLRYCGSQEIAVTAFSPLGAQSYFQLGMADRDESLLESQVVLDIATECGRSAAQVLLRWGLQRGTAIVPKSSDHGRLRQNLDVFEFELSTTQCDAISSLNRDRRFNDPGDFGEAAFNTFLPIYE